MKNYFEEIGFSKEVPNCVLSNTIKAWSNFNINIRPATNNEYIVLNASNTENYIQFELLVGINLYSVRFDGTLDIYRASNKLRSYDHIPVDVAMYILAEMISRASIYRKIIGNKCKITNSKFYGKVPVLLVGWLADLVCWKDKSYTLSEANIGEALCQCPLGLIPHFYHTKKSDSSDTGKKVSMPSRAYTSFLRYPFKNLGFMRFTEPVFAGIYQNILTTAVFRAC